MLEIQNSKGVLVNQCINCGSDSIVLKNWILRNDFKLGECKACGFQFAQPRPTIEYLIEYYNSITNSRFYRHTNVQALKSVRAIHRLISNHHSTAKKVLEIGCSTGYYLQGLKLEGYEVVGTELSSDAVNLAKEWYDIAVYNAEFPPDLFLNYFDVIIIHHVIEHVIEPRQFLAKADSYLAKEGIMILETPNIKSIGISIFKQNYPVLCPPGHLNFFSLETLRKVMPGEHKIVYGVTTSLSNLSVYNCVVALMSVLRVKTFLTKLVSKKVKMKGSSLSELKTNRKFAYGKVLNQFSKVLHFIFYPAFYFLDKIGVGENLGIVSKKVN
jgi:2-polyprenyl-3-methyl-5-hydroxy-6-metoxy-1,4-benzoquinol methylase